jgi:hypothetical protein
MKVYLSWFIYFYINLLKIKDVSLYLDLDNKWKLEEENINDIVF